MTLEIFKNLYNQLKSGEIRDNLVLNLTANENVLSQKASEFMTSVWSNRYHVGTSRNYGTSKIFGIGGVLFRGLPEIYNLESQAQTYAKKMFNATNLECRYLSGIHAVISNLAILTKPGDLILSFDPSQGGHFATQNIIKYLGRKSAFLPFDKDQYMIDTKGLEKMVHILKPQAILFDHGATLFPFNISEIREAVGPNVLLIYDASHVLGLICGEAFQNPLDQGCDIVQGNTHKSFPGPQKAITYWSNPIFNTIHDSIDHAFVSSQHTHHSIALYITILEMYNYGKQYANLMINNAQILAEELTKLGIVVLFKDKDFTKTHTILVEFQTLQLANAACYSLQECNISTNARIMYNKPLLRIGVQELSRKGMKKEEMRFIANLISRITLKSPSTMEKDIFQKEVTSLMSRFNKVKFSFDSHAINS